jgi:hypothetical protein
MKTRGARARSRASGDILRARLAALISGQAGSAKKRGASSRTPIPLRSADTRRRTDRRRRICFPGKSSAGRHRCRDRDGDSRRARPSRRRRRVRKGIYHQSLCRDRLAGPAGNWSTRACRAQGEGAGFGGRAARCVDVAHSVGVLRSAADHRRARPYFARRTSADGETAHFADG